jgi:hypothetical protein
MDKSKFTLGKFSFPFFFATNCTRTSRSWQISSLFLLIFDLSIILKQDCARVDCARQNKKNKNKLTKNNFLSNYLFF